MGIHDRKMLKVQITKVVLRPTAELHSARLGSDPAVRRREVVERAVLCFRAYGIIARVDATVLDHRVVGGFNVDAVIVRGVEVSVDRDIVYGDYV